MESAYLSFIYLNMKVITKNPYRYLGVFSNSPTKERVANKGKMNAFLKVGKQVSFPLDLPNILPPINRDIELVANSESQLTLLEDQVRYAQFWWMKINSLDEIAFNHLFTGDIEMAESIWEKKENVSSLQNRLVLALIQENIGATIRYAESLYCNYANEFTQLVIGIENPITTPLWQMFLDCLFESKLDSAFLLEYVTNSEWKIYILERTIGPQINSIYQAIETAKTSKDKNAITRLQAGQRLMMSTKEILKDLKKNLGPLDVRYQSIADKLATEILQCGIDYFNKTEDDDAPQNAKQLQNYAYSIAVGKLVKDRCKENVEILNKLGEEYIVRREITQLTSYIQELRRERTENNPYLEKMGLGFKVSDIKRLIDRSIPLLNTIKTKLGFDNTLYVNISSIVVSSGINALVQIVNLQQSLLIGDINKLRGIISDAIALMVILESLDMDTRTRNYFDGNKATLDNIDSELNPSYSSYTSHSSDTSDTSDGCYIATMVYGDYNHPQVLALREFRDGYLAKRVWGMRFIKYYYKYSPRLVSKLKAYRLVNIVIRKILDQFVEFLKRNK